MVWLAISLLAAVFVADNAQDFLGRLSPQCVKSYHRLFVTRTVPPRTYQYYHETLSPNQTDFENNDTSIEVDWRIVGGSLVSIKNIPYQVLYGRYCGGALLSPEWVITAAHCKNRDKYVYAGSTQRSLATRYPICAHFIHPLWNTSNSHSHDYDYQLILLEKPIPVTSQSRPIAIAGIGDMRPGTVVSISGWGHLKYRQSKMQDLLRRVFVPILPDDECKKLPNGNYHNITSRMFCAGLINGTKDSCQGDSGGPAVSNGKLLGIVSFGVGCALANQPGVYSYVPIVRDWIRSVTALPL